MKIISKKTMFDSMEITIEIEPQDVGQEFSIKPVHIPYSIGGGQVVDVKIEKSG